MLLLRGSQFFLCYPHVCLYSSFFSHTTCIVHTHNHASCTHTIMHHAHTTIMHHAHTTIMHHAHTHNHASCTHTIMHHAHTYNHASCTHTIMHHAHTHNHAHTHTIMHHAHTQSCILSSLSDPKEFVLEKYVGVGPLSIFSTHAQFNSSE